MPDAVSSGNSGHYGRWCCRAGIAKNDVLGAKSTTVEREGGAPALKDAIDDLPSEALIVEHAAPLDRRFDGREEYGAMAAMAAMSAMSAMAAMSVVDDVEQNVGSAGAVSEIADFIDDDVGPSVRRERLSELADTEGGGAVVNEFRRSHQALGEAVLNGAIPDRAGQIDLGTW